MGLQSMIHSMCVSAMRQIAHALALHSSRSTWMENQKNNLELVSTSHHSFTIKILAQVVPLVAAHAFWGQNVVLKTCELFSEGEILPSS